MAQKVIKYNFFMPRGDAAVAKMLNYLGHTVTYALPSEGGPPIDAVIYTGGPDIAPLLYGETKNPRTTSCIRTDRRDLWSYHNTPAWVPKVGICRGAQFLNVMSGGSMYQHVSGHDKGYHEAVDTIDNSPIVVTSTHHQMMIPNPAGWVMMAAQESLERWKETKKIDVSKNCDVEDAEVVYYYHTESLCFQPHPEYSDVRTKPTLDYFVSCLESVTYPEMEKNRQKKAKAIEEANAQS